MNEKTKEHLRALGYTTYDMVIDAGIEALQELKKRNKGCDYCRGTSYTNDPFKIITKMGREVMVVFNHCPNCGAKMDGDGNGS